MISLCCSKTVDHLCVLEGTGHLVSVSQSAGGDAVFEFIDTEQLFHGVPPQSDCPKLKVSLSHCAVTDIEVVHSAVSGNIRRFLVGCSVVNDAETDQMDTVSVVLIKIDFDILLNRFVAFNELHRVSVIINALHQNQYRLQPFSLRISGKLKPFIAMSAGKELIFFVVDNGCTLRECVRVELADFVCFAVL